MDKYYNLRINHFLENLKIQYVYTGFPNKKKLYNI